jgi:outer membrane protein assembly factor BamE (lipoprotein component of BamABCDE complex)
MNKIRSSLFTLLLACALVIFCSGSAVQDPAGIRLSAPTKYTSFLGIRLGMSESQVRDIMGRPSREAVPQTGERKQLNYVWNPTTCQSITLMSDKVVLNIFSSTEKYHISLPNTGSFYTNMTRGNVEAILGMPSSQTSGTDLIYYYNDRNICIGINRMTDTVVFIGLYDPVSYKE